MSDVPQTLALIILAQNYAGDIVRQVNRTTTALRVLPIVTGEGSNVAWVAESSGAVAEAYADGADAANFGSDAQASAVLAWTLLRANSRVTGLARSSAATSMTPQGNVDLWGRNVVNANAALATLLNCYVFSGNGSASPAQPTGLDSAIGDDTNTYATIVRGSSAYWKPYVVDPGSATAISESQIREDLRAIYEASGEHPDLVLCDPSVFNSVRGLFDSRSQFVKPVTQMRTARGVVEFTGPEEGISVEGVTFLKDKDATNARLYYLNTRYVQIVLQVQPEQRQMGLVPGQMLRANDGFGEIPLMVTYEMLAKTGDSQKFMAKVYCNLKVTKPCACGVRKNVQVV
jgi:hypothetical protein